MHTIDSMTMLCLIAAAGLAYLVGSVNFAIIITRAFAKQDIREFGSGNAGMTNVFRTLGKGPAALTLVGDFLKGVVVVWIGRMLLTLIAKQPDFFMADYICAFCGLLGHCFPIFYRFKGGKGVLVSAGALLALCPMAFLCCLMAFGIGLAATKIVSVGSIVAAIAFAPAILVIRTFQSAPYPAVQAGMALFIGGMILVMHRGNIKRLMRGQEPRLGQK